MTASERGDVSLVGFIFSDESGTKLRPAVVVSTRDDQRTRQEVVTAAVTSNLNRRLFGDHRLADWREAGLLFPSVVTGIYRTIKRSMIERKLGALSERDIAGIDAAIRLSLGVGP